jgi:aminoglycoside 3-N-acetyltransferase
MSEVVTDVSCPRTGQGLAEDLRRLGIHRGDTLLVHSSLRSLGFVVGGAVSVVQALLDVLGPDGTLVVPAFTADNTDPSRWGITRKKPVPPQWWQTIREHLPAFDPDLTPSCNIGAIAETTRVWPGAVRSAHPQTSFAAVGARAAEITRGHPVDCLLGMASPLGRLLEAEARILLLGVGYDCCTAFHLAEYRRADPPHREYSTVVMSGNGRTWLHYRDVALTDADFGQLGTALEDARPEVVHRGRVGDAESRLLPVTAAVAFAGRWMDAHR